MQPGETDRGSDSLDFRAETNTYSIAVSFTDVKLSIRLRDYIDWAIYSKQYSEDDIGKQIHRKVDLIDIYSAFASTQISTQSHGQKYLIKYAFGTNVTADDLPCYKIQSQGKVTVYRHMFERKNNKQQNLNMVTFTSTLKLEHERDMKQMEIFTCKSQIQKRQISEHFAQEILTLRQDKKDLQAKVANLQKKLQNISVLEQKVEKTTTDLQQKLNKTEKDRSDFQQKYKPKLQSLPAEQKKVKDLMDNYTALKAEETATKTTVDLLLEVIKKQFIITTAYSPNFKVTWQTRNIQFTQNAWQQLLINQIIPYSQNYTFKVKIIKTASRNIMIGVTDITKQKAAQRSYDSSNAVAYYCQNGYRYPNMGNEGAAINQGDVVDVNVELRNNVIKIVVNGTARATLTHALLGDATRIFVPYVDMSNNGDIIEWCY